MNLNLVDVTKTSKDGNKFWHLEEIFIKGNSVKYIRMIPSVLDKAIELNPSLSSFDFHF
jgi:U6 snRNA-associated Sm-like protein LSm4